MKAFAIGLVFAAIILAAAFFTPRYLPTSPAPAVREAQADAELARRELHAYDASVPLLGGQADLEQLKEAEFENLIERSADAFAELDKQFGDEVRSVRSFDQRNEMQTGNLRAVSTNVGGVKTSVSGFDRHLRENQALLTDATKHARAAGSAGRDIPSVGHVAGAVGMADAGRWLSEAQRVRADLIGVLGELFAAASDWQSAAGGRDYNASLDVSEIQDALDADIEEIDVAAADAQAEVAVLGQTIGSLDAELNRVRSELEQIRSQQLRMEEEGFTVGNDSSFNSYRDQYVSLGRRAAQLQLREQELKFGGLVAQGAAGAADEQFLGLEELGRRLAIVEQRASQYAGARDALTQRRNLITRTGGAARTREARHTERLGELAARVDELGKRVADLQQEAFELEDKALSAARAAAGAYRNAKSAVDRWKSDARSLQSDKDPQRLNERLKVIVGDDFATEHAAAGEGQAKMLIGRIQAERVRGLESILDAFARVGVLMPDRRFDVGETEGEHNAARDEAIKALGEARDIYERLAQKSTNTSWVYQASLAMVHGLLAQVDQAGANQHRGNLIDQLGKAIANRSQSPHLRREVELYALLTGETEPGGAPAPAPVEDTGDEEAPDEGD